MKFKHSLALAAAALLGLFILQNMATVEVNFLFWSFHTSRFLVILFAVLVGILIGWALSERGKKGDASREAD